MNFKKIGNFFLVLAFLAVLIQFIWSTKSRLSRGPAQDFEVFYLAAQQVLKGEDPYQKLGLDIIRNSPPALLFLAPLVFLPVSLSEFFYFIISLGAFLVASFYLFKILKTYGSFKIMDFWQSKVIYFGLCLRYFPLRHNLGSGQINNFLLLLIVLAFYFYLKKNAYGTASMLAIGICLKLTPLLLIMPLLIKRKYKIVFLTGLFLLIFTTLTTILLGFKIWPQYFAITNSYFNLNISGYYNQAITGLLSRSGVQLGKASYSIILGLIAVFYLYLFEFFKKIKNAFTTEIILWNTTILIMLLFVPFAWQYHFVIGIFPLLTTVYLCWKLEVTHAFYFFLGVAYFLLGSNIRNPSLFEQFGLIGSLVVSHATIGGLVLFFQNIFLLSNFRLKQLKK